MTVYETQLRLDMLGPPVVHLGEKPITFPTRKTFALLFYLAIEGGQQSRDLLSTLLWPESSTERSHASLRNTLGRLQSALRLPDDTLLAPYLLITHHALALNPDAEVLLDLHTVERAYALARADRLNRTTAKDTASLPVLLAAAACNRGDFLSGFSLGDAPGFDDWASIQREVWRLRLGLILDRLSEVQFAQGEFGAAAENASAWIALDALNEVAYRRKMRAHFAAGERGQALAAYNACRAILEAELGVTPEPDTEAIAERIRTQRPVLHVPPLPQILDTPVAFLKNMFAGRIVEQQILLSRYESAAAGHPQIVILRGWQGIGKTRLARAFMGRAAAMGADVLEGRAFESGSSMSYQPLIEAFRPLLVRAVTPLGLLGETWLAPLSHLLPEMRERFPELPSSYLEANGGRTQLFESLVRLSLALAEPSPLILFVDDLQWADSATLDWLVYAVRRWQETNARIMLCIGLRSESLQSPSRPQTSTLIEWLTHMERETEPVQIELGPLDQADAVPMLLSILAPSADDFAEWIYTETSGQPFYLMETLKDLIERRVLHPKRQGQGEWVFEIDAEHDLGNAVRVPSTVRAVILSRLDRLSPNAFTLLAAGSVLELSLTFDHMCAIANMTPDAGLPALDELVSGQLLLETGQVAASGAFTFAHNMIRDVVYTEAGDSRRHLFHQRAFEIFEREHRPASVLAHHALAAGLAEESFQYSLAAGREAMLMSAAREAIAHFEHAHELAQGGLPASEGDEGYIRDLYAQLGQAYELIGDHDQAVVIHDEWLRLGPQPF